MHVQRNRTRTRVHLYCTRSIAGAHPNSCTAHTTRRGPVCQTACKNCPDLTYPPSMVAKHMVGLDILLYILSKF